MFRGGNLQIANVAAEGRGIAKPHRCKGGGYGEMAQLRNGAVFPVARETRMGIEQKLGAARLRDRPRRGIDEKLVSEAVVQPGDDARHRMRHRTCIACLTLMDAFPRFANVVLPVCAAHSRV